MEKVCIVLSTYNGEKYLQEQIDSLLSQEGVCPIVLVRDDGSTDNTIPILNKYATNNKIVLLKQFWGTNLGIAKSFATLLLSAYQKFSDIHYFFFSDQDDFWLPNKCKRAIEKLYTYTGIPALYYSKKLLVNSELKPLGKPDIIKTTNGFWNFFDRSNAFGCTMCITRPLIQLLTEDHFYDCHFLHDNYLYRLCLAGNFPIIYDDFETILYRQHGNNVEGAVKRNIFRGIKKLFIKNRVHVVRDMGNYILDKKSKIINEDNKYILQLFVLSYSSFKAKLKIFNIYRHQKDRSFKEKVMFGFMILLKYF